MPGRASSRTPGGSVVVAGIDPGTKCLGLAILRADGSGRPIPQELMVIKGKASKPRWERLGEIHGQLLEVLGRYRPAVVAIERCFVARDPRAALALGEARGVAIAAATSHGARVVEYTPSEARKITLGKGNADKLQVRTWVLRVLGIRDLALPLDATDAACLAMAASYGLGIPTIA